VVQTGSALQQEVKPPG